MSLTLSQLEKILEKTVSSDSERKKALKAAKKMIAHNVLTEAASTNNLNRECQETDKENNIIINYKLGDGKEEKIRLGKFSEWQPLILPKAKELFTARKSPIGFSQKPREYSIEEQASGLYELAFRRPGWKENRYCFYAGKASNLYARLANQHAQDCTHLRNYINAGLELGFCVEFRYILLKDMEPQQWQCFNQKEKDKERKLKMGKAAKKQEEDKRRMALLDDLETALFQVFDYAYAQRKTTKKSDIRKLHVDHIHIK
jgi:hypothetical protein